MVLRYMKEPISEDKPGVKQSGYNLEREISNSLGAIPNCWFHKWSDTHMYSSFTKKMILPKSPGDFLAIIGMKDYINSTPDNTILVPKPVFIECKSSRNKASYDFTNIPDHQLQAGLDLAKLGMPYYFVINRRVPNRQIAFILRPYIVAMIKDELMKRGGRALKWEWVAHFASGAFRKLKDDKTQWDMAWLQYKQFLEHRMDANPTHMDKIHEDDYYDMIKPLMWNLYPEFVRSREVAKRHKCIVCGKRKVYGQELNEKGIGARKGWECKACSSVVTKA